LLVYDVFNDFGWSDSVSFFSRDASIYQEMLSLFVTFPVATLTPVYISRYLQTTAGTGSTDIGPAVADFFGTATLTEVIVPDGLAIVSKSGTVDSTIIPEPTTFTLFALGLAGLWQRKRVEKRRPSGAVPNQVPAIGRAPAPPPA